MRIIGWALFAAFMIAAFVFAVKQAEECQKQGGVLVRSTWEFVCVEPLKVAPKK